MRRLPDWQLRLEAFGRERLQMPFAWGSNDCAIFAADWIEHATGERLMEHMRWHTNAREALRTLRESDLRSIATAALGEPISPLMARVGDVVVIRTGKREALAVCNGGTAIAPGPEGMVAIPMSEALAAWRVG